MFKTIKWNVIFCGILCLLAIFSVQARMSLESDDSHRAESFHATASPATCAAAHNIGKIVLTVTNQGIFGTGFVDNPLDCFTGLGIPSCEYPKNSSQQYLFGGAFWIGAVVGSDTLVSVGADGWQSCMEMYPDESPAGNIVKRSILDPKDPEYEYAVSEQDYIAVYTDTFTSGVGGLCTDFLDGRPHVPLNIEVTQRSYAWSYVYAEDFVLFDFEIKNIGVTLLENVYIGIYVDGDVKMEGAASGFEDDICGFLETYDMTHAGCLYTDTVNTAWIIDNDGELSSSPTDQVPHVTATSLIRSSLESPDISFNWWLSNGNAAFDFGPRMKSGDFRDFGTGGLGTPEGDRNKYYMLRNGEFDYNQIFTESITPDDPIWMYPSQTIAPDYSNGYDTRYLLSFGPFDIAVGQIIPVSFAYVAGMYVHVDPDNYTDNLVNTYNPEAYYNNLDFTDLVNNVNWASWIYDNPGYDTDGDFYRGVFEFCCVGDTCDTVWRSGDGIPDFRGATPPPAPELWAETETSSIILRWNGLASETTNDVFSHQVDFEGYNVYLSTDGSVASYTKMAGYDVENYLKYIYHSGSGIWFLKDAPFTLQELRCLYGALPNPCQDYAFNPLDYTESTPYMLSPDSLFYFEAMGPNAVLGVTTSVVKRFPLAPYPSTLFPDSADTSELTEDGYLKYFEYELIIDSLLPGHDYWVNVTAYDYGSIQTGLGSLETSVACGALQVTTACCIEITGNVDCSASEAPDISDITRLIDYLYFSRKPLCCLEEA
ncbi:MAG: hypothetical protein ACOYVF_02280, partial [Candidatus Zixiibacteriota bacterium]